MSEGKLFDIHAPATGKAQV